jgi:hypothetical protein
MEDLSAMLSGILSSPESMEQLKTMAGSLFGGGQEKPAPVNQPAQSGVPQVSAGEIAGLMKMANLLKNNQTDSRCGLLLSLRPYLSEHRQKRVDDAVKILRLVSILPAVKDLGIL